MRSRLLPRVLAVLCLDVAVTFRNWYPTPAVTWYGELSAELAAVLLLLAVAPWLGRRRAPGRGLARALAVAWVALLVGRYATVTAPALWGRELNFYWDLRFLPDVLTMFATASHVGRLAALAAAVAVVVLLWGLTRAMRWAWTTTLTWLCSVPVAGERSRATAATATVSSLVLLIWTLQATGVVAGGPVARPVTAAYVAQARLLAHALGTPSTLPSSPAFDGNLDAVRGADVLLTFVESYGAVTFDRPEMASALHASRVRLQNAITTTGRGVVSGYVESPTFGGSSWFAHITLLSGIRVGDPDRNALLMTQSRPTLVKAFAARGWRTVGLMPGLWYPWPEGAFYGFQEIYTGARLGYTGPPFGWWAMPDQFTLAAVDDREPHDGTPRFVFFPTVSTHTPFAPHAPYQPDWARMLTPHPFDDAAVATAYEDEPDWLNLRPGYVRAVDYALQVFAGYLERHRDRDLVLILIGDHQPPALVSGEGAPWDVPVHVIASRPEVLARLKAHGFIDGLTPARPHLGEMHALTPWLMEAFSRPAGAGGAQSASPQMPR